MTSHASIAALPSPADEPSWSQGDWPLGARYDAATSATTFAVAAPEADRVVLEIYAQATGAAAVATFDTQRGPDGRWFARVAGGRIKCE